MKINYVLGEESVCSAQKMPILTQSLFAPTGISFNAANSIVKRNKKLSNEMQIRLALSLQ
jgi:plasmid maintenance system antidote protein VapI